MDRMGVVGRILAAVAGLLLFWRRPAILGQPSCDAESLGTNLKQLLVVSAAMTVAVGAIAAMLWGGLLRYPVTQLHGAVPPTPLMETRQFEIMPTIPTHVAGSLEAIYESQIESLHTYGWVDQEEGVVRLPIERAKDLLLEQGLPVRDQPATP
jgi:hypothetical protein